MPPSDSPRGAAQPPLVDGFGRQIGDLRLSVTDRCNLRCVYWIPEEAPQFQPRDELDLKGPLRQGASDDDMLRLIRVAWRRKDAGHLINSAGFVRPARTMSAIGG